MKSEKEIKERINELIVKRNKIKQEIEYLTNEGLIEKMILLSNYCNEINILSWILF